MIYLFLLGLRNYSSFFSILLFLAVRILLVTIRIIKNWHHIIMILLLIEIGILQTFLSISVISSFSFSFNLIFVFASLIVIEASIGMSLLTLISRARGNDYIVVF